MASLTDVRNFLGPDRLATLVAGRAAPHGSALSVVRVMGLSQRPAILAGAYGLAAVRAGLRVSERPTAPLQLDSLASCALQRIFLAVSFLMFALRAPVRARPRALTCAYTGAVAVAVLAHVGFIHKVSSKPRSAASRG